MKLFGNKNNTKNESQTKKRTKKKRSTRHNSLLYLIGILLVSAVLATTGILLGNDLFALAKEDREITVTIPEDAYFMMGDNRHNSLDSRYWGFVPEDHVVGRPAMIWLSTDGSRSFPSNIRWRRFFKFV